MISIIKWSLTSRLSIKTPLSLSECRTGEFPGYATSSGPQIKLVPKGSPDACRLDPSTLDPSNHTLTSLTLNPTPNPLPPAPYTLNPEPQPLNSEPYILNPKP